MAAVVSVMKDVDGETAKCVGEREDVEEECMAKNVLCALASRMSRSLRPENESARAEE